MCHEFSLHAGTGKMSATSSAAALLPQQLLLRRQLTSTLSEIQLLQELQSAQELRQLELARDVTELKHFLGQLLLDRSSSPPAPAQQCPAPRACMPFIPPPGLDRGPSMNSSQLPAACRGKDAASRGEVTPAPAQQSPATRAMPPASMDCSKLWPAKRQGASKDQASRRRTLRVANYPRSLSDLDLAQALGSIVGRQRVAHCVVARESNGRSEGHAFIEFVTEAAADLAWSVCDAGDLILVDTRGCPCVVEASRATGMTASSKMKWTISTKDLMTTHAPYGLRMIL
jgi:hypothetical protein